MSRIGLLTEETPSSPQLKYRSAKSITNDMTTFFSSVRMHHTESAYQGELQIPDGGPIPGGWAGMQHPATDKLVT